MSQTNQTFLARGRASEILDLGDGRVLRRFLGGRADPAGEAAVMEHARRHGYPVPLVHAVAADSMILEHVEGPTMAADLLVHPERLEAHAATLARLHDELHAIEAPGGGTLLHLDLHPQNVLLAPGGPVVIDWTNARAGRADVDPALTWVILMTGAGEPGRVLAAAFERHVDVRAGLHDAAAYRLADRNVTPAEAAAVRALL